MTRILIFITAMMLASQQALAAADCKAKFLRDTPATMPDMEGRYVDMQSITRKGTVVAMTGSSDDPEHFCQRMGYCFPIAAVKILTPCKMVKGVVTDPQFKT